MAQERKATRWVALLKTEWALIPKSHRQENGMGLSNRRDISELLLRKTLPTLNVESLLWGMITSRTDRGFVFGTGIFAEALS